MSLSPVVSVHLYASYIAYEDSEQRSGNLRDLLDLQRPMILQAIAQEIPDLRLHDVAHPLPTTLTLQ